MRHARTILLLLAACAPEPEPADDPDPGAATCDPLTPGEPRFAPPVADPGNLLVLVLDDVGVELVGAYGVQPEEAAATPTIDRLAADGVLFRHAYANPVCSPTRAALLTGRHTAHFGIGDPIEPFDDEQTLPDAAVTIADVLADGAPGYRRGYFGKWHLSIAADDAPNAPLRQGFDVYRGTLGNLDSAHAYDGDDQSYTHWEQIDQGVVTRQRGYVTSRVVDDTLAFVAEDPAPWLAVVGFHSAHTPWHSPPARLHGRGDVSDAEDAVKIRAMVEALDTELGRLLDGIADVRDRTTVILLSDNGSSDNAGVGEFAGLLAKSHVYEPGVRVPLIVTGPTVASPGRVVDGVVEVTDVFPTLAGLAGIDVGALGLPLDGVDLGPYLADPESPPRRAWAYAETFPHDGEGEVEQMLRTPRFKLLRRDGTDELYDLGESDLEGRRILLGDVEARLAGARLAYMLDNCLP